jgi:protein SCO1
LIARRVRRCLAIAAACISASLLPCFAFARATERHAAFGLVLDVKDQHSLVVSCGDIPDFMDAMVMRLDVANPVELKGIQPGSMIDFDLVVGDGSERAEDVRLHQFRSADQRLLEVETLKILSGELDSKSSVRPTIAVGQKVPEFALIDQHSREEKLSDWSGKVTVVSFMYTRCSSPEFCLRLSNNLGLVAKRFPDRLNKDLVLATITFDPKNDTPEVLQKYAQTWKSSGNGWYFLTGRQDDVKRACLMFGMNFWPDMGVIAHSMHTAVIDRKGVLVANLEGNQFSAGQLGDLIQSVMDRPH